MSVHVVRGDDPILRVDALEALLAELVGDDDHSLAVEDLTVPGKGSGDGDASLADERRAVVAAAVNAALSPPFMTARRVVVLREVGNLLTDDVGPLVACLGDILDTTDLVFVVGGGTIPAALTKAWKDVGAVEHGTDKGKPEDVVRAAAEAAGVRLRPDAVVAVVARVGSEVGRVGAIVDVLAAAFGPDDALGADDVAPYLGDAGSVPPYLLTKAIEEGDVPEALAVLQRLLTATGPRQPKPMHPLQVLAMLHNHVHRVARLDAPDVRSKQDALAVLGGRVRDFQAAKWFALSRRLGPEGIREAYAALAQADLDLKGARAIPEDAVMAVLVARLAGLSARAGGAGGPARATSGSGRGGRGRGRR